MLSHSYWSMVIAKLKALQLILAYFSESSLEGRLVITGAHGRNRLLRIFQVEHVWLSVIPGTEPPETRC